MKIKQNSAQGQLISALCAKNFFDNNLYGPKSVLNLGNSEASYWCAGAGLGITFSSEEYALNPIAAKSYPRPVICSIENTLWKRPIVLACKSSRTDEPLLQEIASTIRELFYNN